MTAADPVTQTSAIAVAETAGRPRRARRDPRAPRRWPARLAFAVAMAVVTVLFLYPFFWLVSASLKPRSQVFDNALLPETWQWENYLTVWEAAPLLGWLVNSVAVGVAAATAVTVSSALVAFGFAYFVSPAGVCCSRWCSRP